MNKYYPLLLAVIFGLTACNQPQDTNAQSTDTPSVQATDVETDHDHDEHDEHEHHDGDGHEHHDGERYECDNGKAISLVRHNHEGEEEVHVTFDDVEYDMHPDTGKAHEYITHDSGINNQPMLMTLDDKAAVFYNVGDSTPFMRCQKPNL